MGKGAFPRMTWNELEARSNAIVSEQMGVDRSQVSLDTNLVQDLKADSLDAVELMMEFEDQFDIVLPDELINDSSTIAQVIEKFILANPQEILERIESNQVRFFL